MISFAKLPFQIYDQRADGEAVEEGDGVVEEGGDGGAPLPPPPLPHPSPLSKVKPACCYFGPPKITNCVRIK